jgi:hypothetical protein
MTFKLEKFINISVGVFLLTNLYLISGFLGIPSDIIIILCLLISAFFFIKNFNINQFINTTNNWNTLFYVLISVPLCLVDWIINDSTPKPNDMIRVLMYSFYFSWTFSLYKDQINIRKWFIWVSFISFIVLTIEGLFEKENPVVFSFLFSGSNQLKRSLARIGGSLVDENSYSGLLNLLLMVIYLEWYKYKTIFKTIIIVLFIIITVYLTDLAGSRQGLIMFFIFFIYLFFKKINTFKIILLTGTILLSITLILVSWNKIATYIEKNPNSSVARFVAGESASQSNQSNIDRKNSLLAGVNLCTNNYFLYGPGMINFASRWQKFTTHHEPHNGLLFIFTQYGILGIIPLIVLYQLAKRSLKVGLLIFFIAFFIHYSLQPNLMYYCTTFFVAFYIDYKYLLSKETE